MWIERSKVVGLDVGIEEVPPWEVRVDTLARFPILEVTTPPNYYPPAQIQYYHVPDSRFDPNPVKAMSFAEALFSQLAARLSPGNSTDAAHFRPASHGELNGYTTVIPGGPNTHDLRLFVMQGEPQDPAEKAAGYPGHGLIVVIAITQSGKIGALNEVLRRSLTGTNYHQPDIN